MGLKIYLNGVWINVGGGSGSAPATTAADDFQVGDGSGNWIKKTLAQTKTILSIFADAPSDGLYYGRLNAAWVNLKTYFDTIYAALSHTHSATSVNVADAGNYFTGTEVETALQELGASVGSLGGSVPGKIEIGIDGGGVVPTTGHLLDFEVQFDITVTGWKVMADDVGNIQFDLWKDTYTNFPPTVLDSVTASDKPLLSSANKSTGSATGWVDDWDAGDIIRVNIDSVSILTKALLVIPYVRR